MNASNVPADERRNKIFDGLKIRRSQGRFLAYSPIVDLCSTGVTEEEARVNFAECLALYDEVCKEWGLL